MPSWFSHSWFCARGVVGNFFGAASSCFHFKVRHAVKQDEAPRCGLSSHSTTYWGSKSCLPADMMPRYQFKADQETGLFTDPSSSLKSNRQTYSGNMMWPKWSDSSFMVLLLSIHGFESYRALACSLTVSLSVSALRELLHHQQETGGLHRTPVWQSWLL